MRDGDVRIEAVEFEEWSGKGSLLDSFFIHDDDFFLPLHHEDFFSLQNCKYFIKPWEQLTRASCADVRMEGCECLH